MVAKNYFCKESFRFHSATISTTCDKSNFLYFFVSRTQKSIPNNFRDMCRNSLNQINPQTCLVYIHIPLFIHGTLLQASGVPVYVPLWFYVVGISCQLSDVGEPLNMEKIFFRGWICLLYGVETCCPAGGKFECKLAEWKRFSVPVDWK